MFVCYVYSNSWNQFSYHSYVLMGPMNQETQGGKVKGLFSTVVIGGILILKTRTSERGGLLKMSKHN